MNKWNGTGRITADLQMKKPNDTSVVSFSIAVPKEHKLKENERNAIFLDIVAFGSNAEYLDKYAGKGTMIEVSGSIRTYEYEKDGVKKHGWEIVADRVRVLVDGKSQTTATAPEDDAMVAPSASMYV